MQASAYGGRAYGDYDAWLRHRVKAALQRLLHGFAYWPGHKQSVSVAWRCHKVNAEARYVKDGDGDGDLLVRCAAPGGNLADVKRSNEWSGGRFAYYTGLRTIGEHESVACQCCGSS
jgi:hypothetical protein